MRTLNGNARANMDATRQGVREMVVNLAPLDLHGEALECLIMERLTQNCHMRDVTDAAIVSIAAMAIARLVEHERGERQMVA